MRTIIINECPEFIKECCIEPMLACGVEFKLYTHLMDKFNEQGIHIMEFQVKGVNRRNAITANDVQKVVDGCHDDQQPEPMFQIVGRVIYIYIHYFG